MQKTRIMLFDMNKDEILLCSDDCLIPDGEEINDIMSRFAVVDDKLNPRLQELEAFAKFDFNFPYNLNFVQELKVSINNERTKILNMCFDQLKSEGSYASLFLASFKSMISINGTYYGDLKDFYVVENKDLDFLMNCFEDGIKDNVFISDYNYHKGYVEILDYYKKNLQNNKDVVLIFESDDFHLKNTLIENELIKVKEILQDVNFHKFMMEFNEGLDEDDDEYYDEEDMTADDYFSHFLDSDYVSYEKVSRKLLFDYVLESGYKNNIFTEEKIKSIRGEQLS